MFRKEFMKYLINNFTFFDSINYIKLYETGRDIIFEIEFYENEYMIEKLMGKDVDNVNKMFKNKINIPIYIDCIRVKKIFNEHKRIIKDKDELIFWEDNKPNMYYVL